MYTEDDLLDLSGLQHFSFCKRQWALIHMSGEWAENRYTVVGALFHGRAHAAGYSAQNGMSVERGVYVCSFELGISGIADIVEYPVGNPSKSVPVEYKVGKPKIEDWDRLQVCAQAMCLEEMLGIGIREGAPFYGKTRRRERVPLSDGLRGTVSSLCREMHDTFDAGIMPSARYASRCKRCSLIDVCMPEASSVSASGYWSEAGEELAPLP